MRKLAAGALVVALAASTAGCAGASGGSHAPLNSPGSLTKLRLTKLIRLSSDPGEIVIAPAGNANAGTAYITTAVENGTIDVVAPGGEVRQVPVPAAFGLAVNSDGFVFVAEDATTPVQTTLIHPDGTTTSVTSCLSVSTPAVAPANTGDAGTAYIPCLVGGDLALVDQNGSEQLWPPGEVSATAVAVAPANTPQAGAVYASGAGGVEVFLPSGGPPTSMEVPHVELSGVAVEPGTGIVLAASGDGEFTSERGQLFRISPLGSEIASLPLGLGAVGASLVIAPAGTPAAGTAYVSNLVDHTVSVIAPSSARAQEIHVGFRPGVLAIAPAGTPNAGTVYVAGSKSDVIAILPPHATHATMRRVGRAPTDIAVAPAGTPDAGAVYVVNGYSATLSVLLAADAWAVPTRMDRLA